MSDLRNQARGRGQVAKVAPEELKNRLWAMEEQFQLAMPRGMEAKQLIRDAMTVFQKTPALADCEPRSVLGALMTCSQLGLRPGVLGQAWVLPFKGKGQLIVGYKGYAVLAQRSGDIKSITARVIREADEWDMEYGLNERLEHRPALGERGDPIAWYSVVRSQSGGMYWEFMSRREVEDHRDQFAMGRVKGTLGQGPYGKGIVQGPWVDNFDAMAKKTLVIKALNLAPASTELQRAFDVDGSTRFDLNPKADVSQVSVQPDDGSEAVEGVIEDTDYGVDDGPLKTAPERDPAEPSDAEWAAMGREPR